MLIAIEQTGPVEFLRGLEIDPDDKIHDLDNKDFYLVIPFTVTAHTRTGHDYFCGKFFTHGHPGFTGLLVNGDYAEWDEMIAKIIHKTKNVFNKLGEAQSILGMIEPFITGVYINTNRILKDQERPGKRQKHVEGFPDLKFGAL